MCVRKVAIRARTLAAHHCAEQLWSDALFRVGVKAVGAPSSQSPFPLEQISLKPRACSDQALTEPEDEARVDSRR